MAKLSSLLSWIKKPRDNLNELRSEAKSLISQIESRLYAQETREGYLNSMRTLRSSRELLQMLEGTSEANQIIFLKKMIKRLKPISKMKYC
jgi:hypothetical protein